MKPELKYIGRKITIKALIDAIHKNELTENDTILLNQWNFDELALEHRETYKTGLETPYFLLGVLITFDNREEVPKDRIGIIRNDDVNLRVKFEDDYFDIDKVYRCGYCGLIVGEKQEELFGVERIRRIKYLENHPSAVTVRVHGKCCPNPDGD